MLYSEDPLISKQYQAFRILGSCVCVDIRCKVEDPKWNLDITFAVIDMSNTLFQYFCIQLVEAVFISYVLNLW